MCVCVYVCMYMRVFSCGCESELVRHLCVFVCVYVCMYMQVFSCGCESELARHLCMYVCIYMHEFFFYVVMHVHTLTSCEVHTLVCSITLAVCEGHTHVCACACVPAYASEMRTLMCS